RMLQRTRHQPAHFDREKIRDLMSVSNRNPAPVHGSPPDVSIVIPAFQAEGTLEATLQSVLDQTLTSWEVIVADDGSADATVAVAERWAARDRRVQLLRRQHGGVSAARNAGLTVARGRTVLF